LICRIQPSLFFSGVFPLTSGLLREAHKITVFMLVTGARERERGPG